MIPTPTHNDDDLRALFAPLSADEPTPAERHALRVALADAPAAPARPRLTWKPVAAVATATIAVGVGLAVLPGSDTTNKSGGGAGVSILHTAAAEAAGEPVPSVLDAPFRYTKLKTSSVYTETKGTASLELREQQDSEAWVGAKWTGREVYAQGTQQFVGDWAAASKGWLQLRDGNTPDPSLKPRDTRYAYGDGPLAELDPADLPSDRNGIAQALRHGIDTNQWSADAAQRGKDNRVAPKRPIESYVTYSMLNLLSFARVTPAQRAAMLDVLSNDPSAKDLGTVKDNEGREGRGVQLHYPGEQFLFGANRFVIIFNPDNSEILQWSIGPDVPDRWTPNLTRTVLSGGYVAKVGDRP
ncbi:hypothetical protein DSM104299_01265 [Baekduia alba]|uniref:hypothetical protein n=1 Tax=Baekduia alba TaxID=2997333 RepID=UPI002342168A|nr:hypothetical protein [Baekduia alba]WCB92569.1 hypothetical protein DSM104299_01265 [Baekduia alba]